MGLKIHPIVGDRRRRSRIVAARMSSELDPDRLSLIDESLTTRYSLWIRDALDDLPENFLITDPCISGHPIVFASSGFLKMSGYSREEIVGRNGRIFQGPGTDRRSVSQIREAIRQERTLQISLLNYRKDGTPIWVLFHLCPIFGKEDGRVIHFVAVQVPICRRSWGPGSGFQRNRVEDYSTGREIFFGSCRREFGLDPVGELGRVLPFDSYFDSDNRVNLRLQMELSAMLILVVRSFPICHVEHLLDQSSTSYNHTCGSMACLSGRSIYWALPWMAYVKKTLHLDDPCLLINGLCFPFSITISTLEIGECGLSGWIVFLPLAIISAVIWIHQLYTT